MSRRDISNELNNKSPQWRRSDAMVRVDTNQSGGLKIKTLAIVFD